MDIFPKHLLEPFDPYYVNMDYTDYISLYKDNLGPKLLYYDLSETNESVVKPTYNEDTNYLYTKYVIPEGKYYDLDRHIDDLKSSDFRKTLLIPLKTNDDDEFYIEDTFATYHKPIFLMAESKNIGHNRELIIVSGLRDVTSAKMDHLPESYRRNQ